MTHELFHRDNRFERDLIEIYDSLIVRLSGEISIKSEGVRRYWQKKLTRYIRNYIKKLGLMQIRIYEERSRIYLFFEDKITESYLPLIEKIIHTFGVSSISLAKRCDSDLESIKECSEKLVMGFLEKMRDVKKIETFGIVCKKSLSPLFGTTEVRNEIGRYIKERFNLSVNLDNPDLRVNIDVREEYTFIYFNEIPGYGGLPFGVQEKLVALISGGPDSTLAAWMALRRGSPLVLVYYDFGIKELREKARERVINIAKTLIGKWTPTNRGKLYIVPFDMIVKAILRNIDDKRYYYVLLKRFMFHVAYKIAELENAFGVVSGEILGEHASQTAWNLNIISSNAKFAIHRPVFGFDKPDVFRLLRVIDKELYENSSSSIETCREITGAKPTTKASLDKIVLYEKKLFDNLGDKLYKVLDEAYIIEL